MEMVNSVKNNRTHRRNSLPDIYLTEILCLQYTNNSIKPKYQKMIQLKMGYGSEQKILRRSNTNE